MPLRQNNVDNLPRRIELESIHIGASTGLVPVIDIEPPSHFSPKEGVELAVMVIQQDPLLDLVPGSDLIGWSDEDPALGTLVLCDSWLSTFDKPARLAVDPAAIQDYRLPRDGDIPADGVKVRVQIRISGNGFAPVDCEITLSLLPAQPVVTDIELLWEVPEPSEPLGFPTRSRGAAPERIGSLQVRLPAGRHFISPFKDLLSISGSAVGGGPLRVAIVEDRPGRGPELTADDEAPWAVHLDARRRAPRANLYLWMGDGAEALAEPVDEPVQIRLEPAWTDCTLAPRLLLVAPQQGAPQLTIEIRNHEGQAPLYLDLTDTSVRSERTRQLPSSRWSALGREAGASKPLIRCRINLTGRVAAGEGLLCRAEVRDAASTSGGTPRPFQLTVEASDRADDTGWHRLDQRHRAIDVEVMARLDGGVPKPVNEPWEGTIDLVLAVHPRLPEGTAPRSLILRQPLVLEPALPTSYLAIDLGTSSIAAAYAIDGGETAIIDLGSVIALHDEYHDEAGSAFISSVLGLDPCHAWRPRRMAASLWGVLDGAPCNAEAAAAALQRHYSVAVPLVPASEFGAARGRVVMGPKMLLMDPSGRYAPGKPIRRVREPEPQKEVVIEDLVADLLHELVHCHLPWATSIAQLTGVRLVLTHPNLYDERHRERLQCAAAKACDWLASNPGDLLLVRESDAAAYHFLHQDDEAGSAPPPKQPLHVLVYDIGAGTVDLTLLLAEPTNSGAGMALTPRPVAQLGAGVGGDAIDLVLFFIIDAALRQLPPGSGLAYRHRLTQATGDALGQDRNDHLSAKRNLAMAIRDAKADLSRRCRAACAESSPYRWPDLEGFRVKVGRLQAQSARWPVQSVATGARLSLPVEIARGVRLDRGSGDDFLWLEMDKAAVQRPAMMQLMEFLTGTIVDLALADTLGGIGRDTLDRVLVSGRAALWPLIYEGLARTMETLLKRPRFHRRLPPDASEMKEAVVRGAIAVARSTARGVSVQTEDRLETGLLLWNPDRQPAPILNWRPLRQGVQQEILGVGMRVSLMKACPGLTFEHLRSQPWALSLLIGTGIEADAAFFEPPPDGRVEVRWKAAPKGFRTLQINGFDIPDTRGAPRPSPALHQVGYDVSELDRPVNMASVEPDPLRPPPSQAGVSRGAERLDGRNE